MQSQTKSIPTVETFANCGRVWLADDKARDWARLDTPKEVDELIAALETAKRQAWPEKQNNAAKPHEFVGRIDRWCEVCNKPDRSPIHIWPELKQNDA